MSASVAVTLVIYGVVELVIRPVMPALQFNWFKAFGEAIALMVVYVAVFFALHVAIPPMISLRTKGIAIQQGQHVTILKHSDIKAVHIVLRRNGLHFMRVETAKGSKRIGLSRKVPLLALGDHVGDKLVIHDRIGCLR